MNKLLIILSLSVTQFLNAQVYPQLGARSNALGGSSLTQIDAWSTYNNPGALGYLENTEVGVAYENRFLVKEMANQALTAGICTKKAGNFGLHFQQYGFNLFREMQGGFSYGMALFDQFSAGVSFNFHRISLGDNYGSTNTVSAAIGVMYYLNESLSFGMRMHNINRARLADFQDERLPTTFAFGARYDFSEKARWMIDVEKDLIHPVTVKSGIEIQAHEIFTMRMGATSYPFQASMGFGLKLSKFYLDMASSWHTQLGLSPSAGILYRFE